MENFDSEGAEFETMILKFEPCGNSKGLFMMWRLEFYEFLVIKGICTTPFFRLGHIFHF